jgi:hypothetical protein
MTFYLYNRCIIDCDQHLLPSCDNVCNLVTIRLPEDEPDIGSKHVGAVS